MKKAASLRPDMKKAPCGADFVMVDGRGRVSPARHGLFGDRRPCSLPTGWIGYAVDLPALMRASFLACFALLA